MSSAAARGGGNAGGQGGDGEAGLFGDGLGHCGRDCSAAGQHIVQAGGASSQGEQVGAGEHFLVQHKVQHGSLAGFRDGVMDGFVGFHEVKQAHQFLFLGAVRRGVDQFVDAGQRQIEVGVVLD